MTWKFYVSEYYFTGDNLSISWLESKLKTEGLNSNNCRRTCKDKVFSLLLENSFSDLTDAHYTELVC